MQQTTTEIIEALDKTTPEIRFIVEKALGYVWSTIHSTVANPLARASQISGAKLSDLYGPFMQNAKGILQTSYDEVAPKLKEFWEEVIRRHTELTSKALMNISEVKTVFTKFQKDSDIATSHEMPAPSKPLDQILGEINHLPPFLQEKLVTSMKDFFLNVQKEILDVTKVDLISIKNKSKEWENTAFDSLKNSEKIVQNFWNEKIHPKITSIIVSFENAAREIATLSTKISQGLPLASLSNSKRM